MQDLQHAGLKYLGPNFIQFIAVQLKKIIYPRGIFKIKYENNNIDEKFLASIISFIFLYIVIFFVITALYYQLSGLDLTTSISAAATSISNVGPGLGDIIGPNGNFSNLSDFSKWILSLAMILGRLELFAVLVLFIPSFLEEILMSETKQSWKIFSCIQRYTYVEDITARCY